MGTATRPTLTISRFRNLYDNQPKVVDVSWDDLKHELSRHCIRRDKDGPLISPAVYLPGATRANDNARLITAFFADLDDGTRPEELTPGWDLYAYALYSTHSSTPEKPKWRAVFPLKRPVPASEWPSVWAKLAAALTHARMDPQCKEVARFYYLPAAPPGAETFVAVNDGAWLDPDQFEDLPPSEEEKRGAASTLGERIPSGQRNAVLFGSACAMRRKGFGSTAIEAALLITNTERCDPPLDDDEVKAIAASAASYAPAEVPHPADPPLPDEKDAPRGNGREAGFVDDEKKDEEAGDHSTNGHEPEVQILWANTVEQKPVAWFWNNWLPAGKLTLLDGDGQLGKSLAMVDIAARYTTGSTMPDGSDCGVPVPGTVLMMIAEDDPDDTVCPRLSAAGADLKKVGFLQGRSVPDGEGGKMVLPIHLLDLKALRKAIRQAEAGLLIVDPVMSFIPTGSDTYRETDVRRIMGGLKDLAAEKENPCTIVLIRHPTKQAHSNPLYVGSASIGFINSSRSAILVAMDPTDEAGEQRVWALNKHNLAAPTKSRVYRIQADDNVPKVVWDGTSDLTAQDLVSKRGSGEKVGPAMQAVLDLYTEPGQKFSIEQIAALTGKSYGATKTLVCRMKEAGYLVPDAQANYSRVPEGPEGQDPPPPPDPYDDPFLDEEDGEDGGPQTNDPGGPQVNFDGLL